MLLLFCVGAFCWLTWMVEHHTESAPPRCQTTVLEHQQFWQFIAIVFDPKALVIWDFVLAGGLTVAGFWQRGLFVLAALGTLDLFGIWLKHHVKRPRPQGSTGYSYPSGHTLGTTMMALLVAILYPHVLTRIIVAIIWILVVYSRLTLRAHHLTDVIAAILLATCWWIVAEWIYLLLMRWK